MKKILLLFSLITLGSSAFAQNTYTIDNETLELKTEVDGTIDLLWASVNNTFRYFLKDNEGNVEELKNTKHPETKKYQEEYKTVLSNLTNNAISTKKLKLTLSSLKTFFDDYNASQNIDYTITEKPKVQARIGAFGGLTNNPFIKNVNNKTTPFFGLEFEIFEATKAPRHAGFFSVRHALEHKDFDYSATQLALGYRYRFINQPSFNIYANIKFATYTFSKIANESVNTFDAPLIFGLGSDIKINKNSFITFAYNELFAVFIDNQDNFPIDFAVGYKINL